MVWRQHICLFTRLRTAVGCSPVVAVVHSAAVNGCADSSDFTSSIDPRVAGGDRSRCNYFGSHQTFPQRLHHFPSPPAVRKGSSFSPWPLTLAIFCVFDTSHPTRCDWSLIFMGDCFFNFLFTDSRETDLFIPHTDAFTGCFLYVL